MTSQKTAPRTTSCKIEFVQDNYGSKTSLGLNMQWRRSILNGNTKIKQFDSSLAFAVLLRCCFAEDGYEMYKGLLNTLVQPLFCSLNLLFGGARRGLFQTLFTLRRRNLKSHTALFLRLSLGSRVIRHENEAFRKRFLHRFSFLLFVFAWAENILKTELLKNNDVTIIMWFSWPGFPKTQIQDRRRLVRFQISPA